MKTRKNMNLKFGLFSLIIGLLLAACAPEPLEIVVPPLESKVVVFSQIIPEVGTVVLLTRSFGALDFNEDNGDTLTNDFLNQLLVSGAQVVLRYRDFTDTLEEVEAGTGIYAAFETGYFPNEDYTLDIQTAEGETLTATSRMLPVVPFETISPTIDPNGGDTIVRVDYSFVDPPGDNWYMINFYTNGEPQNDEFDINSYFQSGSTLLKKTRLLSDAVFDSALHEGSVKLHNIRTNDSLVVTISNINEAYYRFLDLRKNSSNFFTELTKEPVNYPTNVDGGLGFFNTHFPDARFFDLNDY